jgi:hypothetical protein
LQHLLIRTDEVVAGDKKYVAPDVAVCLRDRSKATIEQLFSNEIWALGVTMYELCTGQKFIVVNEKASTAFVIKKLVALAPVDPATEIVGGNAKLNRLILDMISLAPAQRPRPLDILQRLDKLRAENQALYATVPPTTVGASSSSSSSSSSVAARSNKSARTPPPTDSVVASTGSSKKRKPSGDMGEPSSDAPSLATPATKKAVRVVSFGSQVAATTTAAAAAAANASNNVAGGSSNSSASATAATSSSAARKRKPGAKDSAASEAGGTLALHTVTDTAIPLPAHPELPVVASTSTHHTSADDDGDASDEVPYGTPNERGIIRLARRDRFAAALVGIRGANAPAWMVEAERVRDVGIVAQRAKQREVPCPCGRMFSEVAALQEHGAECEDFQEETQRTGISPATAVAIPPPHAAKLDPLAAGVPLDLPSQKRLTELEVCVAPPALLARISCSMNMTGRKTKQAVQQALLVTSAALLKSGGANAVTVAPSTATVRLFVPRDAHGEQFGVGQLAPPAAAAADKPAAPVFAAVAAAPVYAAGVASAFPDWIDQADLMPAPPEVARIGRPPKVPPAAFWCVCGGDFDTPYAKANHIVRCARFKNAKSTGQLEQLLEVGRVTCVCGLTLPTAVRKSQHATKCKEFQTWRHSNPRK